MKKFRNIFLVFFVCLCTAIFCACDFNFSFYGEEIDPNFDSTQYIEVVSSLVVSTEEETQEETQEEYFATSEELTENQTLSKLLSSKEKIRAFNVYIETKLYDSYFGRRYNETTNLGSGSIIYINETSKLVYVLTNYHVVTRFNSNTGLYYGYCSYTVETINANIYSASLVYYNEDDDMAILSFTNNKDEELTTANLTARSDGKIYKDEFLLAVGNPSGVRNIVTYGKFLGAGKISNVNYQVIHHNVLINPGNSGGALTDINGNFVGINTWGTDGDDEDNYSIPLKKVISFLNEIREIDATFPQIA